MKNIRSSCNRELKTGAACRGCSPKPAGKSNAFTLVELPVVSKCKSNAFTLVELLVVVAIIALLMAILVPSLGRAREQTGVALCASNLRSIGVAFNHYTNKYDQWYPGGSGWGGDPPIWDGRLQPFYEAYEVLYCPSDDLIREGFYEHVYRPNTDERYPHYPRSYAINISVSYRGPSVLGDEQTPPYRGEVPFTDAGSVNKTTDVQTPSETILLGESWDSFYYGSEPWPGMYDSYRGYGLYEVWGTDGRLTTFYHFDNDSANFLFCDHSVKFLKKNDPKLKQSNGYYYYQRNKP